MVGAVVRGRTGASAGNGSLAVKLAERLFELAQLIQSLTAEGLLLLRWDRWRRFGREATRWGFQAHLADIEVFFKAIGLQEVGEFEGADIAAALPNLPLQVHDHPTDLYEREALVQQLIPLPFTDEVQAQLLAG